MTDLLPPGRIRATANRTGRTAEQAHEGVRVVLPAPATHREGPCAVVAVVDDTRILHPVEPPQERTVDANGVIESHRLPFNSWCSVKIPYRRTFSSPAHFFCGGASADFFSPRSTKKRSHGAGGTGWSPKEPKVFASSCFVFNSAKDAGQLSTSHRTDLKNQSSRKPVAVRLRQRRGRSSWKGRSSRRRPRRLRRRMRRQRREVG